MFTKRIVETILLFFISVNVFAENETLVASIEIGATEPVLSSLTGPYINGTGAISLSFNEITTDRSFDNECIVTGFGYSLTFDKFYNNDWHDNGTAFPDNTSPGAATNQSWIIIENTGNKPITKIVFKGGAAGNMYLFCDVILNNGLVGFLIDNGGVESAGIPFNTQNTCYETTFDLTSIYDIEDFDFATGYTYEDIKTIRLTYSGANGETSSTRNPSIQAMYIYVEGDGLPNSLQAPEKGSDFFLQQTGDVLEFNQIPEEVCIYDIFGKLQIKTGGNSSLNLNELASGIYIVKATSVSGESLVTKITR